MGYKPGLKPNQKRKAVGAAGTAEQIEGTSTEASYFTIQAAATNTGVIYVGTSDVSATLCMAVLDSGQSISIGLPRELDGNGSKFNLSDFWIDSSVSGEEVNIGYFN